MTQRPDASMDLLRHVRESALDPGYAEASASGRRPRPVSVILVFLLAGVLLGFAFGTTNRAAPSGAAERAQLIDRIRRLDASHDELRTRILDLRRENVGLERGMAGLDPDSMALADQLSLQTGNLPVSGPGIRVIVDDGPDTAKGVSRVLDTDVRVLVNALWSAGAEAITVNGHRLSARTAIREAGDAITVDYRSLTRPYEVLAIGDPKGLTDGLAASTGGAWWRTLEKEYQMRFSVERANHVTMNADPGLGVELARTVR